MAQNDRFVVKHVQGVGWAVKKTNAGRASSVHETQREAEKRAKEIVLNLGGGEVRDLERRNTQRVGYNAAAMIPPRDRRHGKPVTSSTPAVLDGSRFFTALQIASYSSSPAASFDKS